MENSIFYTIEEASYITGATIDEIKRYTLYGFVKYFNKK